jgi:hypothetical protein
VMAGRVLLRSDRRMRTPRLAPAHRLKHYDRSPYRMDQSIASTRMDAINSTVLGHPKESAKVMKVRRYVLALLRRRMT